MVGMELKQQLKLSQQLVMTPQLQQAIKLLQLSRLELTNIVQQELEENPMLEESVETQEQTKQEKHSDIEPEKNELEQSVTSKPKEEEAISAVKEIDWEKYLENYTNQAPMPYRRKITEDLPDYDATLSNKITLVDHLLWQMKMTTFTKDEEYFIKLVIGNLDSRGYWTDPSIENLAEEAELEVEDAEEVLLMIQKFDPVGVASRNLKECLLAQVDSLGLDTDVRYVVGKHLFNLQKRNYQAIAKDMNLELCDVYEVVKIISNLEPMPARNFIIEEPRYIIPDVYIHKYEDKYIVTSNDDGLPKLKISNFFKKAINSNPETKEYVQNKMRSAQWLIKSIHQRRRTIIKVTQCIVDKQVEFLDRGINFLKPMILRDIADEIEMHESTISRVTTNKYVHTPQGIFELKYFFNTSIRMSSNSGIASESVKNKIREIINAEDKNHPLSDQKIVDTLKEEDIIIARRTIAKYRELLGFLSSSKRKKYF